MFYSALSTGVSLNKYPKLTFKKNWYTNGIQKNERHREGWKYEKPPLSASLVVKGIFWAGSHGSERMCQSGPQTETLWLLPDSTPQHTPLIQCYDYKSNVGSCELQSRRELSEWTHHDLQSQQHNWSHDGVMRLRDLGTILKNAVFSASFCLKW